jgi:hypothetical protein
MHFNMSFICATLAVVWIGGCVSENVIISQYRSLDNDNVVRRPVAPVHETKTVRRQASHRQRLSMVDGRFIQSGLMPPPTRLPPDTPVNQKVLSCTHLLLISFFRMVFLKRGTLKNWIISMVLMIKHGNRSLSASGKISMNVICRNISSTKNTTNQADRHFSCSAAKVHCL